MGTTVRSTVRTWWRAALAGLVLALLFGALVASRNPDWPPLVGLTVVGAVTWPVFVGGLQMLWFDRARTEEEISNAAQDVERAWFQEAAATAFVTMIGGLLFLDGVGDALNVAWMSPVGLTHALVLGLGTFAASYLWLRARGR